jgi:lipooligosaccharide transport system permease protein
VTALLLSRLGAGRAPRVVERNLMVYRHGWLIILTGFFEPLFYLLSIGIGLGALVGPVEGVSYKAYVAPALLASSAMNGAVYDSTYNIYFKLQFQKTYDAMLATPLGVRDVAVGEITWALMRGLLYAALFLLVMLVLGLVSSPWALLALPAAVLIGFAFASVGMAATTFMRSWQDFEFVQLAVLPLFLFSATFYPLSTYPSGLQWLVAATPLFQGVSLLRDLCLGSVGLVDLAHVLYLVAMGSFGVAVTSRRLEVLLLR